MNRTLTIACLLALGLALPAFAQRGAHTMSTKWIGHPDLAVEKIAAVSILPIDDWFEVVIHVVVRNIGSKSTPPCNVMLTWCGDATASKPVRTWLKRTTYGLEAGVETTVVFEFEVRQSEPAWQGLLVAVADPPVQGKPTGEINEWPLMLHVPGPKPPKSETNNVFGVIFNCGSSITPIRWDNPLMQ